MSIYESLEQMLASERAGVNPHGEGSLKGILSINIFSRQNTLLWGRETAPQLRKEWQLKGIDPDSANEVDEYRNQIATTIKSHVRRL